MSSVVGVRDGPADPVGVGAQLQALMVAVRRQAQAAVRVAEPPWVGRTVDARDCGAVGDGVHDDTAALQRAIHRQQLQGGVVWIPAGTYRVREPLVCVPLHGVTRWPCVLRGEGMRRSVLCAHSDFVFNGLLGHHGGAVVAQVAAVDLTLDGNYCGVADGRVGQPLKGAGALVSLPHPFTDSDRRPGLSAGTALYHRFERVRFYRPSGYAVMPASAMVLTDCVFEGCGQPDAALHYTSIGGAGLQDCLVCGCSWIGGAGNCVDFASVRADQPSRVRFLCNVVERHRIGGLYAAGRGSVIAFNAIGNDADAGAGVGYNALTLPCNRGNNLVLGNTLRNIRVHASGLSPRHGDRVLGNLVLADDRGMVADPADAGPAGSGLGHLAAVLRELAEALPLVVEAVTDGGVAAGPSVVGPLAHALGYIDAHLHQPLSPAAVAAQVGLSSRHLSRLLRSQVGLSLGEYVQRERLRVAAALLCGSDLPVKDIAARSGYRDVHHFTRVFSQAFGQGPATFRRTHTASSTVG